MENNLPKKDDAFTGTQVGVLVEGLRSEFRLFAEDLTSVKKTVNVINHELGHQREDIFVIKTDIRFIKNTLSSHDGRLSRLEEAVLK